MDKISATSSIISTALTVFLVTWILRYLASKSRGSAGSNAGDKVLRYSKMYEHMGWFCIGFLTLFAAFMMFIAKGHPDEGKFGWLFFPTGGLLLGVPLIMYGRNVVVSFNQDRIESRDFFRRSKTMFWNEIKEVSFGFVSRTLTLSDGKQKITVNLFIVGFSSFLEMLQKKLDHSLYKEAMIKIEKTYQAFQ